MHVNEVVQTTMYAKKGYTGRKVKIINIQHDIEPGVFSVTGFIVLKSGLVTRKVVSIQSSSIIVN